MVSAVVAIVVLLLLAGSTVYIVPQQGAYIIERLGRFHKVSKAGTHVKIPFIDAIASKTNLRVSQLDVTLETKTLDNVFVTIKASTQFRVLPNDVATAYYELQDPRAQIKSYMEDALRSAIPAMSLDDVYSRKDDVAQDVQHTVGDEMSRYGFTVVRTLVTSVDPSTAVKDAMDSINAAQRERRPFVSVPRLNVSKLKHKLRLKQKRLVCKVRVRLITVVRLLTVSLARLKPYNRLVWILLK